MPTSQSSRRPEVLWVDDEVHDDDPSVGLLRLQGFKVLLANTGEEGLRLVRSQTFQGILLDLRLPDMHGLEFLQRLSKGAVSSPVLVLSGFNDVQTTVRATRLGAWDVADKPLCGNELISSVAKLTARSTESSGRDAESCRLLWALTITELPALEFIEAAQRFRRSIGPIGSNEFVNDALAGVFRPQCIDLVERLQCRLTDGAFPNRTDLAASLLMSPDQATRAIQRTVGLHYGAVRRLLRLRPALRDVVYTHEHIAQIAFMVGYEFPGQFDRDFRLSLGISPGAFRHLGTSLRSVHSDR